MEVGSWNSIFNVEGKQKTKTESRIPFSNDVGKRKTKLEVRIPFSYFAGKRLALKYTHYKGNHNAALPWFGTKIAQKHVKRIKKKT